jgi:hypothetical protein
MVLSSLIDSLPYVLAARRLNDDLAEFRLRLSSVVDRAASIHSSQVGGQAKLHIRPLLESAISRLRVFLLPPC